MWILVYVYNHNKPEIETFHHEEFAMANFRDILEDNEVDVTDKMLADKSYSHRIHHNDESPYSWHVIVKEI